MVDVFISYPRVERAKVEIIKAKLDALGLETFFDVEGIDGGEIFPDVIDRALKSAKAVLGVWTPRAFKSKWCMIECRVAERRGVLVPVALEEFDEFAPPADFMMTNYLDLTDFDGAEPHEGWTRTLRALSRHVTGAFDPDWLPAPDPNASVDAAQASPAIAHREGVLARTRPGAAPTRPGASWRDAIPGVPEMACPEMVSMPPGAFLMGSPTDEAERSREEGPQHEVRIDYRFALGKLAVTFAEWDAALTAGANLEKPSDAGWGRGNRPVINVGWSDAQDYIRWLNERSALGDDAYGLYAYRLPSEAEWEYACRAGTSTPFSFGATISTAQANYDGSFIYGAGAHGEYRKKTTPGGSFAGNPFGLHDMHGNVWEWVEDGHHDNYNGAPTDGSPWASSDASRHVFRGGSWFSVPQGVRSAYRDWNAPAVRNNYIGFRVARTLPIR